MQRSTISNESTQPNILEHITATSKGGSLLEVAQQKRNFSLLNEYYQLAVKFYTKENGQGISTSALDSTTHQRTILFWAIACYQNASVITSLLGQGSDTEEIYYDNNFKPSSALFTALGLGNIEAISALLSHNRNLATQKNEFGATPAHYAAEHDKPEILEELYRVNKFITKMPAGTPELTPLHTAAQLGRNHAANWILEHDATVCDLRDAFGNTALHLAVQNGHVEIVKLLLDHGAKHSLITAQNAKLANKTPLQLAASSGNNDIVRLLMKDGARPDEQHAIESSKLMEPVQIALSLLEYIDSRKDKPEFINTIWGYNGGFSKKDKIDVVTKVMNNIFDGTPDPLDNLSSSELVVLKNGKTGELAKALILQHSPLSSRSSPATSTRTSPSPKGGGGN